MVYLNLILKNTWGLHAGILNKVLQFIPSWNVKTEIHLYLHSTFIYAVEIDVLYFSSSFVFIRALFTTTMRSWEKHWECKYQKEWKEVIICTHVYSALSITQNLHQGSSIFIPSKYKNPVLSFLYWTFVNDSFFSYVRLTGQYFLSRHDDIETTRFLTEHGCSDTTVVVNALAPHRCDPGSIPVIDSGWVGEGKVVARSDTWVLSGYFGFLPQIGPHPHR